MSDLKSAVVKGMLRAAQDVFGANAYVGSDSDKYLTGIPLKHVCLRWLFDSNVFPVSKMILLYGLPRQQKSTLSYEFMRLFGEAGAVLAYVENEGGKYSPDLFKSFLRPYLDDMLIMHPTSVEEAQSALNMMKKQVQGASDKRELLSCFVLDSLFGSSTDEKHEQLKKEDHAGRAHPAEALLWSSFLQTYTSEFMGWPMSLIVTNHMKVDTTAQRTAFSGVKYRIPGGDAQRFFASMAIKVARSEKPETRANLPFEGKVVGCNNSCLPVFLHTDKSSIGQDHRTIAPEMVWWRDDEGQHTFFDWYACDIRHLAACQMGGEKAPAVPNRDAIRDICDLTVARGRYASKVLGVDGVTDHEAGWILQQKPELIATLDRALGIAQHPVFEGKMPSAIAEASKRKKPKKEDADAGLLGSGASVDEGA